MHRCMDRHQLGDASENVQNYCIYFLVVSMVINAYNYPGDQHRSDTQLSAFVDALLDIG